MVLEEISLNLINVADKVLLDSEKFTQTDDSLEFVKNGRKYKLINNENFERIRESEKFLIVADDYNGFKENHSLVSSYYILKSLGEVVHTYPDLCLTIMGAARELELNKWYDLNVCVTLPQDTSYDPSSVKSELLKFASKITKQHINNGLLLLCAAKINFFHTDHTASKKIEGVCLRNLISELFGEEALSSEDVYNAIRSFSHWGSIKGILYKLELRNLWVDYSLQMRYRNFPDPPLFFKQSLYERYPAGTSKYSLCKKALIVVSKSVYGKLLPVTLDLRWLFELCHDIESDPCKYHLRSSAKNLSRFPVNLSKLPSPDEIFQYCAAVMHGSNGTVGKKLLSSSKFPKKQQIKTHPIYVETRRLNTMFNKYRFKPGSPDNGYTEAEIIELVGDLKEKSLYGYLVKEFGNEI